MTTKSDIIKIMIGAGGILAAIYIIPRLFKSQPSTDPGPEPDVPIPPTVITRPATGISAKSVIFNGALDSLGTAQNVELWFEYGPTTNYNAQVLVGSSNKTGVYNIEMTGLSPNTQYFFRAKAIGHGTGVGEDSMFTTAADIPQNLPFTYSNPSATMRPVPDATSWMEPVYSCLITNPHTLTVKRTVSFNVSEFNTYYNRVTREFSWSFELQLQPGQSYTYHYDPLVNNYMFGHQVRVDLWMSDDAGGRSETSVLHHP